MASPALSSYESGAFFNLIRVCVRHATCFHEVMRINNDVEAKRF
jgi:hypothetical protein